MSKKSRLNPFHSLRTQLVLGAIILLGITLATISYSLIENQKRILRTELEKTIIYQGRNIALSSEKALLRTDPEFELVPLVKRITEKSADVETLVITDRDGVIQGDLKLQNISQPYRTSWQQHAGASNINLFAGEQLRESGGMYYFSLPVLSGTDVVGQVYMGYSKGSLTGSIKRAVQITIYTSAAAFGLGIILALLLFRRISRPMDVMMQGVNALGEGELDTRIQLETRNEFQVLAQSFNDMAGRIVEAQRELVEKELVDKELEIAHDIQSTLIPATVEQPVGFEIDVYYKSAMQVGGDYVDVFPVDGRRVALVMADVSGKGVPGLVVMAMLKVMVQELLRRESDPKIILRRLNISLARNIKRNMFVTMFLAVLDRETNVITYTNAGHNPLVILDGKTGEPRLHRMQGPPLGIFADDMFASRVQDYTYQMAPGDLVVQYTDGLTESMNKKGEQFDMERLVRECAKHGPSGARAAIGGLVRAELDFRGDGPQRDDLTLLAVSATVPAAERLLERS